MVLNGRTHKMNGLETKFNSSLTAAAIVKFSPSYFLLPVSRGPEQGRGAGTHTCQGCTRAEEARAFETCCFHFHRPSPAPLRLKTFHCGGKK